MGYTCRQARFLLVASSRSHRVDEQRRIVAAIEEQFSRLDAAELTAPRDRVARATRASVIADVRVRGMAGPASEGCDRKPIYGTERAGE